VTAARLLVDLLIACPQCAMREEGHIARWVVLGLFIVVPYLVVAVVYPILKRASP